MLLMSVALEVSSPETSSSVSTDVSGDRKNIARKTGIKTIAGLTAYAILNNLIDAEPKA